MIRSSLQVMFMLAVACAALVSGGWERAQATFPQPPWTGDGHDVARCSSTVPGGNFSGFIFFATSGPGAFVEGNYISWTCNFKLTRNGSGYTAGVSVIVDYCPTDSPSGPSRQTGNFNTDAGTFAIRSQQRLLHQGSLVTITLFTNTHGGADDFTVQELVAGSTNLSDLNRPQGPVPCPNPPGGTTQDPGGAWSITLTAEKGNLIAGNQSNLTALANKTTANTGYRIWVVNRTDNKSATCTAVAFCTVTDFKSEPGARTYQAIIANGQGQDIQAASEQVTINWAAWSGSVSLTAEKDIVNAGDVAYMNAAATPTISGSIYKIRIERFDNGELVRDCIDSPCRGDDVFESAGKYKYVARVMRVDGTDVRASSAPIEITWKATEQWNGTVHIRIAGGRDLVGLGVPVVLEAEAYPDLTASDYVLTIYEETPGGEGASATCDNILGQRCTLVAIAGQKTARIFGAKVHRRDGTGAPKAVSDLVTVSWSELGPSRACDDGWRVTDVIGQAYVLIGGTLKQPLKPGQWVCPRDRVETGSSSSIRGEFNERGLFNRDAGKTGTINVDPKTQLEIDFIGDALYRTRVDLKTGRAFFNIEGVWESDFKVVSPTAVTSVRGTIFEVAVEEGTGSTHVVVFQGQVLVDPNKEGLVERTLLPGDQVTVTSTTISAVTKIYGNLPNKRRLPALARDGSN